MRNTEKKTKKKMFFKWITNKILPNPIKKMRGD